MAFDWSKINEGVTTFGEIVQKGVETYNSIANNQQAAAAPSVSTGTIVPAGTQPPAVTTTTKAAAGQSWLVPVLAVGGLLLLAKWR